MDKKRPFPEPVEALVLILMIFASILVLTFIGAGTLQFLFGDISLENNVRLWFVFGEALFLIIPLLYCRRKGYPIETLFRFRRVDSTTLLLSFLLGLGLIVLTDELERLINMVVPQPELIKEMMAPLMASTATDWLLVILGSVILAAVAEEGLFRGFLQVTLEKKGDVTRAVILAAVSWTIIHINPYWAIQIFVMGVFLGFLAWRTGSIWPAVIIHASNNLLALLMLNFNWEEKATWYTSNGHVSPFLIVLAAGAVYWTIRQIHLIHAR